MRIQMGRATALVLVLAFGLSSPCRVEGQEDEVVIGSWEGELVVSDATQNRVVFHVERGEDGGLTGTVESPDERPGSMPLSSVTFEDGTIIITRGRLTFRGTPSDDGTTLSGTMSGPGLQLPLELTKRE